MRHLWTHDPFTAFDWLRTEIDRVFDAGPDRLSTRLPLNVLETENGYEVVLPLAGADPEKLDVSLDGDVLKIAGERSATPYGDARRLTSERQTGAFERQIRLPDHVDAGQVRADFKDGLLRITLAKDEKARARSIAVTVN